MNNSLAGVRPTSPENTIAMLQYNCLEPRFKKILFVLRLRNRPIPVCEGALPGFESSLAHVKYTDPSLSTFLC